MENFVFVVVDMQKGLFSRDVLKKESLMQNINLLIDAFHACKIPVVFFRHTNSSFLQKDTDEWQLCTELRKEPCDAIFDKSHSSVFKEKRFVSWLKSAGITRIYFSGLVSNGCVQNSCLDALEHGYEAVLPCDAHSTWHKDAETVIESWNNKLANAGVVVMTAEKLAKQILNKLE